MQQNIVVFGSQNTAMIKEYFEHFVLNLIGVHRVEVAMFATQAKCCGVFCMVTVSLPYYFLR